VQEAVNIKMLNNMAKYATTEGDLEKYKWVRVIQGYTETNAENNDALPESVLQIAGKDVLSIDESLKNNLSISETEVSKYYVTPTGKVYYQGFEYEGNIYYDKDTIGIGTPSAGNSEGGNIALGSLVPVITPESKKIMVSVNSVRYKYSKDGGLTWEPEGGTTSPNYTFENLDPETEYSIKVMAIDSLDNTTESSVCSTTTLEDTEIMDGTYNADKGVNSPKLDTGMIAVYWDTNGNEIAQYNEGVLNSNFVYNDWYDYTGSTALFATDYTSSKWANAKTPDGSYWVWIPRYAYSITSGYHDQARESNNSGKIDIEFMKGLADESKTGRILFQNALGQGNWNIHPAFRYNDGTEKKLAGIWVAKYEMSNNGSNVPQSKPGIASWRSITVADCFTKSKNMYTQYNSHLIRNCEWGAVAYLAQSKYGRHGMQVGMNSSNFITGASVTQSTTGNKYGVFDMNGGAWEYVAAGLSTNVANTFGSANVEYYDAYTSYGDRYGDAVYETSTSSSGNTSWYGDISSFLNSTLTFHGRAGFYGIGEAAGLFGFSPDEVVARDGVSFRTALWGAL